jgi:hypothetical protein
MLGHNAWLLCLFKNSFAISKNKPPELENFGVEVSLEIIAVVQLTGGG